MSRRPLVYAAPGVLRQARSLLPTVGVIEEAIADEIVAGNVVPGRVGGMVVGSGWIAQFLREPGRTNKSRRVFMGPTEPFAR